MEALFTKGPMTVSVDAEPKSFVFYKEGVYNEPKCRSKLDQLDHAVIVSGCAPCLQETRLQSWRLALWIAGFVLAESPGRKAMPCHM